MGEEDEVTTLGKVELPCNGRNISVRACKAAFRQKLGSIAVREFRPVICNCRAAHYNSPFLASELTPSPPPQPPPLLPRPTYPPTSRSVQRRVLAFVRFLAFSLSPSLSLHFLSLSSPLYYANATSPLIIISPVTKKKKKKKKREIGGKYY